MLELRYAAMLHEHISIENIEEPMKYATTKQNKSKHNKRGESRRELCDNKNKTKEERSGDYLLHRMTETIRTEEDKVEASIIHLLSEYNLCEVCLADELRV